MKYVMSFLFLMVASFAAPTLLAPSVYAASEDIRQYTCPMHTHYFSDHEGTCPICGMDLVALDTEEDEVSVSSEGEKEILYWVAPMNADYRMDKPGKSPMGMDLVPVYAQGDGGVSSEKTGRAIVKISSEMIQNTGVRTEKAQMVAFGTLVRSYGDVTENIRLQSDISGRVSGWIKDLKIKAQGDEVKKGDLLFLLDSPELISAQQDYISALTTGIKGRIGAAQRRLGSLGVQDKAIKDIRAKGRALAYIPFYATQDGIVNEITIREGSYVDAGMMLMQIQDYASVWVDVSIAEQDIPYINKTTKARVSLPNLGLHAQAAQIDYIYPTIDRSTRTGRVRLVLDNPNKMIKPGAYVDVEFETDVKLRLSVPSDAILKSKDGDFIVVAIGKGRFQPRKISSGLRYKGRTEILDGIVENDDIVVSGQFLIDSESALRESFRKMRKAPTSSTAPESNAHAK